MAKLIYLVRTNSALILTVLLVVLVSLMFIATGKDLSGFELAGVAAAATFVYSLLKNIEKEDLGYTRKKVFVIEASSGDLFEREMNKKLLHLAKDGRKVIEIRSIDRNRAEIYFIAKYDETI